MAELKKYKLIYKAYEIGMVTELSSEWPRPSGTIELNESLKEVNAETKFIFDYFDFSINAAAILENGDHEEYGRYCMEHEFQFLELIDSKDWFLIDDSGKKNNIIVPILSENNEIVWTAFKD